MNLTREKRNLDHQTWKLLKENSLQEKRILVALSGGVDSVALLRILSKIHKKDQLGACYFHHGEDSNQEYRAKAQLFCEKLCRELDIPYFALKARTPAKSEESYRDRRYQALADVMKNEKFDILATGHHRDDLLETRLIRLIRGTGAQGLRAMQVFKTGVFRPLLEIEKKDLKKYLQDEGILALEDPSNESLDPLRNWMRNEWLPSLEKKSKGAMASLSRSLETIAKELESRPWGDLLSQNEAYKSQGLSRGFYLTLGPFEQKKLLAQYLFSLGKRNFSQSQLEEIQKRLDKSQKVFMFNVGGCIWEINAEQIKVQS